MQPILYCLSGSLRGTTLSPEGDVVTIGSDGGCTVVLPNSAAHPVAPHHATLREDGSRVVIEAAPDQIILVNERRVDSTALRENDLLRLGLHGPLLRFRNARARTRTKTLRQMVTDSAIFSVENTSGSSRTTRYGTFAKQFVRDAVENSTRLFRGAVLVLAVAVVSLGGLFAYSWSTTDAARRESDEAQRRTQARLETLQDDNVRLQAALELDRASLVKALEELGARRQEDTGRLSSLMAEVERVDRSVDDLSRSVGAAKDIYARCAPGICLISLGLAFYDEEADEFVRYVCDPETGVKLRGANGPMLRIGGEGPKLVIYISGTGFVVSASGLILSNRHVVDPWREDALDLEFLRAGLKPHREAFVACFPGLAERLPIHRVSASDDADVALVRLDVPREDLPVMALKGPEAPASSGEHVVLIGYPLGLEGLINKLDAAQHRDLRAVRPENDGDALRALVGVGAVEPTMTAGVLSNVRDENLVYDASTTSGGSGGPIFASDGEVIGINTAITRFGGANFGVPIRFARLLLAASDVDGRTWDEGELRLEPPAVEAR